MKQTRTMSLIEAATNVVVGYVLAIATQLAVFPVFDIEAALHEHLAIGLAFVGVSLARGYLLRRLFEAAGHDEPGRSGQFKGRAADLMATKEPA
jgi:hypothetical protein